MRKLPNVIPQLERLAAVVVALTLLLLSGSIAQADDNSTAATFAKLKPSLAIIENSAGVGTGFCIASTDSASYYLTNAHVVGSDTSVNVYRQGPSNLVKMAGTVIARGLQEDPDLAVVRVPVPGIAALRLRINSPREGDAIAVAGYPTAQYRLAAISGDLTPSVHSGTVSAIANRGAIIEYDAQTLPGNSGGPLFDTQTGDVLGVVRAKLNGSTDANIAIGIGRMVVPFLKQYNISYQESTALSAAIPGATTSLPTPDQAVIRTLPGAGTVVVVYDTSHATGNGVEGMIAQSASDFASKFGARFGVRASAQAGQLSSKQEIIDAAHRASALIVVPYGSGFRSMGADFMSGGTKWEFKLTVSVDDAYGQGWLSSVKSKDVASARDASTAVISSFADLNDQVVSDLYERAKANANGDDSMTVNLFRYALPIENGGKRSFFNLKPGPKGAEVSAAADFGSAAEAGLQIGDVVLSVNGVSVVGMTAQAQIADVLKSQAKAPAIDLLIVTADGNQTHIKFEPKDIRWYVERRANMSP